MFNNITRNLVRVAHCCLLAVIFILSSGCEAPLVLDEVEKTELSPIRRTDNFQAIGSFGQNIIAVGAGGLHPDVSGRRSHLATAGNSFLAFLSGYHQLQ